MVNLTSKMIKVAAMQSYAKVSIKSIIIERKMGIINALPPSKRQALMMHQ